MAALMGEAILRHLRLPKPATCDELDGALTAISSHIEHQLNIYIITEGRRVRVNAHVFASFEPLLSNNSACANIVPYSHVAGGTDEYRLSL